jgi:hypothetical protein
VYKQRIEIVLGALFSLVDPAEYLVPYDERGNPTQAVPTYRQRTDAKDYRIDVPNEHCCLTSSLTVGNPRPTLFGADLFPDARSM